MKNILLLGKGFVGLPLFKKLQDSGFNVQIVSKKELDYFSPIQLKKYIRNHFVDYHGNILDDIILINCSGYTGIPNVDACENDKENCFLYNTKLPSILNNFCNTNNIWFINVSSGCIYTGYKKEYTEDDLPNFGLYNLESSFYSKTKHLAELLIDFNRSTVFRVRMPFCSFNTGKNILNKILKYSKLVNFNNSYTCLEDFCIFVDSFIKNNFYKTNTGIYNVVNPGISNAKFIVEQLSLNNHINPKWEFVDINDLNLKANRSNCILSTDKISSLGLELPNVEDSLIKCIQSL